ncbi:putative mitochondrial protein AtMg00710 [Nicotiana tabacum]|uniref:Mitochondrial protein AtMg00710 n=1 Tax=Nicotiana tabacum TaxID=4097 RepID=A0AC58TNS5_TOBAC
MTPQQNGVVERMNITLLERACCMISNARLRNAFWAEAISTTCYIVNCARSAPLNFKTPKEMWSGTLANYSDLKILGCPAYMHVNYGKLEPRDKKCIFLGKSTQKQVEYEIDIPSRPSLPTLEQNTVETPKVDPEA